mmetsp:Transcript_75802/g.245412  ORF Transcript_75802/g.245412 Transcript_75802/m.245412 type:complete len:229 (+) Transcript_75802:524-1210(+)
MQPHVHHVARAGRGELRDIVHVRHDGLRVGDLRMQRVVGQVHVDGDEEVGYSELLDFQGRDKAREPRGKDGAGAQVEGELAQLEEATLEARRAVHDQLAHRHPASQQAEVQGAHGHVHPEHGAAHRLHGVGGPGAQAPVEGHREQHRDPDRQAPAAAAAAAPAAAARPPQAAGPLGLVRVPVRAALLGVEAVGERLLLHDLPSARRHGLRRLLPLAGVGVRAQRLGGP